jgi:hypothetical protein
MLEAQALHRVGEFDVDAKVVGVALEYVVGSQGGVLRHLQRENRNRALDTQMPVPVAIGVRAEVDHSGVHRAGAHRGPFASPTRHHVRRNVTRTASIIRVPRPCPEDPGAADEGPDDQAPADRWSADGWKGRRCTSCPSDTT